MKKKSKFQIATAVAITMITKQMHTKKKEPFRAPFGGFVPGLRSGKFRAGGFKSDAYG